MEEMLEVYYNSGQFQVTMKVLEAAVKEPFTLYDALGVFYREMGYADMSHSRVRRCEILLEFCDSAGFSEICEEKPPRELLTEALTFDIYYRENAKARPGFAKSCQPPREWKRAFERKGRNFHLECFTWNFPKKEEKTIGKLPEQTKPRWVLFDYDHRDPLDHQARLEWLEEL